MLTKTQTEIMREFVASINTKYSINEIALKLGKKYPLIYRSIIPLIEREILSKDEHGLVYLNYRKNYGLFSYLELNRKEDFLKKEKDLEIFLKDCFGKLTTTFFTCVVFGSSVYKRGRDIDLLFIFSGKDVELNEKIIRNVADISSLNLDIHVVSEQSAYEMLARREQANVFNELLNNHIVLFGGENFYKMIDNGRQ